MNYNKAIRVLKKAKKHNNDTWQKQKLSNLIKAFEVFQSLPMPIYTEQSSYLVREIRECSTWEYSKSGVEGELLQLALES